MMDVKVTRSQIVFQSISRTRCRHYSSRRCFTRTRVIQASRSTSVRRVATETKLRRMRYTASQVEDAYTVRNETGFTKHSCARTFALPTKSYTRSWLVSQLIGNYISIWLAVCGRKYYK